MATQTAQSMISKVSICNQALSWVGANFIVSLEEPSAEGEWCRNNYSFIRDAVIEARMWTFAKTRGSSTVADKDQWDQYYLHRMPEEWLQVFRVFKDTSCTPCEWEREGEYIRAEEDTIYMVGVQRIVDTNKFTQQFVQTLAARLASDMAVPLTEDRKLAQDMFNMYLEKLHHAGVNDGKQGRSELEAWEHRVINVR